MLLKSRGVVDAVGVVHEPVEDAVGPVWDLRSVRPR